MDAESDKKCTARLLQAIKNGERAAELTDQELVEAVADFCAFDAASFEQALVKELSMRFQKHIGILGDISTFSIS